MKARRSSSGKSEANDLDAVLESVRSMWVTAEKAEPPVHPSRQTLVLDAGL